MTDELRRIGVGEGDPKLYWFPAIRPDDAGAFPTIGARGCFLSHLEVLRLARDARVQRILLLEDDQDFVLDMGKRFRAVIGALETTDWSIFYGTYEIAEENLASSGIAKIGPEVPVRLTSFILLNGPVIGDLVAYLDAMLARDSGDPQGGPMHVDGAYSWFRRSHPEHRTFIVSPELGWQRPSMTDVHRTAWYDNTPLVRDLANLWRFVRWKKSFRKRGATGR